MASEKALKEPKWKKKHIRDSAARATIRASSSEWQHTKATDAVLELPPEQLTSRAWADDPYAIASRKKSEELEKELQQKKIDENLKDWPWEGLPDKLVSLVRFLHSLYISHFDE
jgi:hypothetical protein